MNPHTTNIVRIKAVHRALERLAKEVVFVGGATVSLYATSLAAEETRPTLDVDIVVELAHYGDYAALETQLRTLGFKNDQASGIICRYLIENLVVDVMPTESGILGFANRWYKTGFESAMPYEIDERTTVRIFTPPYFLASKMEAFKSRGNNDGRSSSDFEDLIYLLNNRDAIWQECTEAPEEVRNYLQETFSEWLLEPSVEEWISCHLEYPLSALQTIAILEKMQNFIAKDL